MSVENCLETEGRILLVEDEALVALEITERLRRRGFEMVGVADRGDKALSQCRSARPDLVLLDIRLPGGMDGVEIAEALRGTDVDVVFLTAHADEATLKRARAVEPAGFLLKPFDDQLLDITLKNVMYARRARHRRAIGQAGATLEQRVSERTDELARSRDRLQRVLDRLFVFVGIYDLEGTLLEANAAPLEAAGLRREEVIGKPFAETYWWSHSTAVQDQLRAALASAATGETVRYDAEVRVAEGQLITIDVMFGPLVGDDGQVEQVIGCAVDVTDRRQMEGRLRSSLREKEALLREVHHRVKNNLQVISSLLYMQATRSEVEGLSSALDETRERVRAMALVHESLYRSDDLEQVDLEDYLRQLVAGLCAAFRAPHSAIELALQFDSVAANIEQALPCGLIVNELVTNAFQHGLDQRGRLEVSLSERDGRVRITVSDSGPGMPDDSTASEGETLGLSLVRLLSGQLGGELVLPRRGESKFLLSFPTRR